MFIPLIKSCIFSGKNPEFTRSGIEPAAFEIDHNPSADVNENS